MDSIKKKTFFFRLLDNIKLIYADKKSQKIISTLRKHPRFSADKALFIKFVTQFMYNQGIDLCVFFADGDNLRIANEMFGEEEVDKNIELILSKIKEINQKYGYENALIGINGDEIFITIPYLKPEDKQKIYDEYRNVRSDLITISVGYCDDMSNGTYYAFNQAESYSQKEKLEKKAKNHQNIFKEDSSEILAEELRSMLAQLRIHVDSLTRQQKELLKSNVVSSFDVALRVPQGIFQDVKNVLFSTEKENFIEQQIEMLETILLNNYSCSITPTQRENFVLSQILSKNPINEIEKVDYFLKRNSDALISKNKKRTLKKLRKQALVSIELSGIKDINDTYGHSQCDKMVFSCMSQICDIINKFGIKKASPVFEYNISSYGFLIPSSEMPKIDEFRNTVSFLDTEFKIAISCNCLGKNINQNTLDEILSDAQKTSADILTFLLDSSDSINKESNRNINSQNKINDKKSITRYISRNLKRITQSLGKELDLETVQAALNQVLNLEVSEREFCEPLRAHTIPEQQCHDHTL